MKDSGIEWIGKIPENWEVKKLKYCSSFIQAKYDSELGELPYIGLENIVSWNGNYIDTDSVYDRNQSLVFAADDILWGKLRPYLAKVYHAPRNGCCSGEFCVIRVMNHLDKRYFWNLLITSEFVETVNRSTYGTKMPRANADFIKNIKVPIPPVDEQERIACFLDTECARIDAVIEKTRASIEEYKNLKQAIITQAVTKGIRPNRQMKDSGSSWIGMIPIGWNAIISRFVLDQIGDVDHYMPESVDTGIPYVMTGDLKKTLSDIDFESCKKISSADYEALSKKIKLSIGDIIFARYATIGTVCYVDAERDCIISYSCVTIKPTKDILHGKYLYYYLQASTFFEDVSQYINSNTQGNVGIEALYKVKIPVPPIAEQHEIADYLDGKTIEIDGLMQKKEQLLYELTEYKKALIFEYVTGKKEVPSAPIF